MCVIKSEEIVVSGGGENELSVVLVIVTFIFSFSFWFSGSQLWLLGFLT